MRVCPRCQATYSADERFCPMDGGELREQARPPKEKDSRVGQILAGTFELAEICGRGAMGTVYRAWQLGMDRPVAVKVLRAELLSDPDVVKRFHREARVIARLAHPNIVTCHLVGETDDGVPFLVMELIEGEPLADIVARGPMMPMRALAIARQISSALADAHAHGIVHRDLKPANILVTQRRRAADFVKVLDFGIAKLVGGDGVTDGSQQGMRLTKEGSVFGTPHYLAPEQAAGHEVDQRADLYSLGVILYRMVTGKLPFEGSGLQVLLAHVNLEPPPPRTHRPELDAGVDALIQRAMVKDPAKRFQSAEEMSDAIDTLLGQEGRSNPWARSQRMPAVTVDPTVPYQAPRPPGSVSGAVGEVDDIGDVPAGTRRRWLIPLVALPAAALGAIAVIALWPKSAGRFEPAPVIASAPVPAVKVTVTTAPTAPAPQPEEPPTDRTETLGERGYAVRATFPIAPRIGEAHELSFDVLSPDGAPLAGDTLVAIVEEPSGARKDLEALVDAAKPGRFRLSRTFDTPGRYFVHVYPDPRDPEAHIWIDFLVGDAAGAVPPAEAMRGELHGAPAPEDRKLAVPSPPVPKVEKDKKKPKLPVTSPPRLDKPIVVDDPAPKIPRDDDLE